MGAPVHTLRPGTTVDRFVVEGVLGVGGMASVYAVRHTVLGSRHALKLLHLNDPRTRERLAREGHTQATLRHPNVLPVTDIVAIEGALGLVMELVEGHTLRHLLNMTLPTLEQADDLARGLLAGTLATHARGVVHRDLKPTNILVSVEGASLVPRIADFGLVKALGDAKGMTTRTGESLGTPGYMSPEQLLDARRVDHRADVFALGAILYELVTGARAFGHESVFAVMTRIREGRYKPIRELRPDATDAMCAAIEGALVPDMEQRIPTVRALAAVWTGLPEGDVVPALERPPQASWSADILTRSRRRLPQAPLHATPAAYVPPVAPSIAAPHWIRPAIAGGVTFVVVVTIASLVISILSP